MSDRGREPSIHKKLLFSIIMLLRVASATPCIASKKASSSLMRKLKSRKLHRALGAPRAISESGSLKGLTAFVTGSTDGIGQHTATRLAKEGCNVIIHGRSKERLQKSIDFIKSRSGNERVQGYIADFESLDQVRRLADEVKKDCKQIDLLINNAGVFNPKNRKTCDGYETTWQVNVLAPFLLTSKLIPCVEKSEMRRVIMVSSISQSSSLDFSNLQQEKGYSAHNAYSISKLADAMIAYELAERLESKGITVNTLDPGTVNTKMLLEGWGACGISIEDANDQFWLATSGDVEGVTGKYYVYRNERRSNSFAYDKENRRKLWEHLCDATGATY
mmetsp:Transcript_38531/g.62610  ORF Transcript_38531/g.62610 Transcript_38531/m.62610 type:complete len:333 (-) Transcript_38531:67-1065(-)